MYREIFYLSLICSVIVLCKAEDTNKRWKRQSDASTEVVGLCLDDAATGGDYKTLKRGARSVSRSREKRGLFDNLNPVSQVESIATSSVDEASQVKTQSTDATSQLKLESTDTVGQFGSAFGEPAKSIAGASLTPVKYILTAIQGLFNKINFDFKLAQLLEDFVKEQNNPVLTKMVVTRKGGLDCAEVCKPGGNGYATIGLCTGKYCICNYNKKEYDLMRCEDTDVFDTIGKKCSPPSQTVLCSDDQSDNGQDS